jgi:hypothetical protein
VEHPVLELRVAWSTEWSAEREVAMQHPGRP